MWKIIESWRLDRTLFSAEGHSEAYHFREPLFPFNCISERLDICGSSISKRQGETIDLDHVRLDQDWMSCWANPIYHQSIKLVLSSAQEYFKLAFIERKTETADNIDNNVSLMTCLHVNSYYTSVTLISIGQQETVFMAKLKRKIQHRHNVNLNNIKLHYVWKSWKKYEL